MTLSASALGALRRQPAGAAASSSEGSESPYAPLLAALGALIGGRAGRGDPGDHGARPARAADPQPRTSTSPTAPAARRWSPASPSAWSGSSAPSPCTRPAPRDLREDVQRSLILRSLNELMPPSGPVLNALDRVDPAPSIVGPATPVGPPDPAIADRPRRAARPGARCARARHRLRARDRGLGLGRRPRPRRHQRPRGRRRGRHHASTTQRRRLARRRRRSTTTRPTTSRSCGSAPTCRPCRSPPTPAAAQRRGGPRLPRERPLRGRARPLRRNAARWSARTPTGAARSSRSIASPARRGAQRQLGRPAGRRRGPRPRHRLRDHDLRRPGRLRDPRRRRPGRARARSTPRSTRALAPAERPDHYISSVNSLPPEVERRRRLVTRTLPLAIIAVVAFVVGAVHGRPRLAREGRRRALHRGLGGKGLRGDVPGAEPGLAAGDLDQRLRDRLPRRRGGRHPALARSRLARGRLRVDGRHDGRPGADRRPARSPSAWSRASSSSPTTTAASPGTRASSSPACGRASTSRTQIELAPRAPILAADGSAARRGRSRRPRTPAGQRRDRRHRRSRDRRRRRPAGARTPGLLAPRRRSASAASSRPSTRASPASPAARCSPSPTAGGSARIIAKGEPAAGRAGEDDDRPRPAGIGGLGARRPLRRRRRPRRPQRRRPGARRPGLLRPAAARAPPSR